MVTVRRTGWDQGNGGEGGEWGEGGGDREHGAGEDPKRGGGIHSYIYAIGDQGPLLYTQGTDDWDSDTPQLYLTFCRNHKLEHRVPAVKCVSSGFLETLLNILSHSD